MIFGQTSISMASEGAADDENVEIMPPMPVHPEQMVTLSKDNRKAIFESSLSREAERNATLGKRRAVAWTIFASLLFFIGVVLILYWMIREYRRMHPRLDTPLVKRDLASELVLLEASDMALNMRFGKLGQLLRELLAERMGRERIALQGKTVPELRAVIENNGELFGIDTIESLRGLLEFLDVVEFSPEIPLSAVGEKDWHSYINLLRRLLKP